MKAPISQSRGNKVLAVIPARGGSKRVPGKNVRGLCGRPALVYTVEAAFGAAGPMRVVVSTDDQSVAKVATAAGAEVPFYRPEYLATDDVSGVEVAIHAVEELESQSDYKPDILVYLQPTSPLRTAGDVDAAIELMTSRGVSAVVSVCAAEHHPFWTKQITDDGFLVDMFPDQALGSTRQELPAAYRINGAIYAVKRNALLKYGTFFPEKTLALVMPQERSVDIDTDLDFKFAEFLLGLKND